MCNKAIVTETIHALQLHRVVQPFESCADLGPEGIHQNYKRDVHAWEARAGFVHGTGSKKSRQYGSRWEVRRSVRELISTNMGLKEGILRYFRSRLNFVSSERKLHVLQGRPGRLAGLG